VSILETTVENIRAAADAIRSGKLVVIPTETVYGLAADATNPAAVRAIFAAKGRPAENPLIVHIAEMKWLDELVAEVPDYARQLAGTFWPGPLTLVLKKLPHVLAEVTAGLDSVAVRMPSNEVALEIIVQAGVPVAAPSANRFMAVSPTRAEHVGAEIASAAAMIIDGGTTQYGLESTVVDCLGEQPRILRPGGITRAQIEEVLGRQLGDASGDRRSPGQYPRHYAPKARVRIVDRLDPDHAGLTFEEPLNPNQVRMDPDFPRAYGAYLYEAFHLFDERGIVEICIQRPPDTPEWEAVWDRLRKASH
jgi:L-threonylcarbamoyladenylate synthase